MKKLLNNDWKLVSALFLTWKLILIIAAYLSIFFIPLAGRNFLGGGFDKYNTTPLFFGWANFDGEHYLSIAQIGYRGLEQAFFPVYPGLMRFLAEQFGVNVTTLTVGGLIISNMSFFLSLLILYKLLKLDYSRSLTILTLVLILIFPTSFYFGAVYSESLFLFLCLLSFYFARKGKWFLAGILGMISSATRIFGILLLPALILEAWQLRKSWKEVFWIVLIPFGLITYIFYQWLTVGDPLSFYHLQKIVGPQHESGITTLPQVYFRYIKMMLTINFTNPISQTIILEFFVGIIFFLLPIYGYVKKVRLSYLFFALAGFLLPTIQGSFSSIPRYVIVIFPSFLCLAFILQKNPRSVIVVFILASIIFLILETALFLRGYWVS